MPSFENCCVYLSVPNALDEFFSAETFATRMADAGGRAADSPDVATHIVVHNNQQADITDLIESPAEVCSLVWFFACMQANKPLSPDLHPLYRPFPASAIPGAIDYGEVTISGFSNVNRLAASTLIQAAGFKFNRVMNLLVPGHTTAQSALLIAQNVDAASQKTDAARKHGIPIVNLKWLLDCLEQWKILPFVGYTHAAEVSLVFSPSAAAPGPEPGTIGMIMGTESGKEEEEEDKDEEQVNKAVEDNNEDAVIENTREITTVEDIAAVPTGATDASALGPAVLPGSASTARPRSGKVGFGSEFTAGGGGVTQAMGVVGDLAALLDQETELQIPGEQQQHPMRLASLPRPPAIAAAAAAAAAEPEAEEKLAHQKEEDDTPTPSALSLDENFTQKNKIIEENNNVEDEDDNADKEQSRFLPATEPALLPLTEAVPEAYIDDDEDVDVGLLNNSLGPADGEEEIEEQEQPAEERAAPAAAAEEEEEEKEAAPAPADDKPSEETITRRKRNPTPPVLVSKERRKRKVELEPLPEQNQQQQQKRARGRKQRSPSRAPSSQPEALPEKAEEKPVRRSFRAKRKEDDVVTEEKVPSTKKPRQVRGAAAKTVPLPKKEAVKNALATDAPKEKAPPPPPAVMKPSKPSTSAKPTAAEVDRPEPSTKASAYAITKKIKEKTQQPAAKKAAAKSAPAPPRAKQQQLKNKTKLIQAHIALSGMHTAEQKEMVEKFSKVNGVELTTSLAGDFKHDWQPEFTHIIAPSLKRNQKCLAALASGAWIVGPDFATACQKAGKLVDAEAYELERPVAGGNDTSNKKSSSTSTESAAIEAGVARFWRLKRDETGVGAFNGLSFTIITRGIDEPPSKDDLTAMISAGGGTLVPLSQKADVVIAGENCAKSSDSVQKQVKGGAVCVKSMYIVDWLSKPSSKLEEHVLFGGGHNKAVIAAEAARGAEQRPEPESSISL